MSGSPVEGWEGEDLEPMRPRYRMFAKHLEAIFDEGLLDGHQEHTNIYLLTQCWFQCYGAQ